MLRGQGNTYPSDGGVTKSTALHPLRHPPQSTERTILYCLPLVPPSLRLLTFIPITLLKYPIPLLLKQRFFRHGLTIAVRIDRFGLRRTLGRPGEVGDDEEGEEG